MGNYWRVWTDYFEERIIQRGRDYFENGKVKGYSETEDSCMARVLGTHVYNVRITGLKSGNLRFSCDCRYAKDGYNCKHQVAVLCQWEDNHTDDLWESEELESDNGNTYFNVREVFDDADIEEDDYLEAHKLIEQKRIELTKAESFYVSSHADKNGELVMEVEGTVQEKGKFPTSVRIVFAKDRVLNSDCFAKHLARHSFYGYYGSYYKRLCAHKIALLLLADKFIAKYNPGDETDLLATKILHGYRKLSSIQKIDENTDKKKLVRLVPKLTIAAVGEQLIFNLNFKIGLEKLYVLKSIPELLETRLKCGSLALGKNNIISFMDYDFDENSFH